MQNNFDAWVEMCEEVDALLERESLQKGEATQRFERHKVTWERKARKKHRLLQKSPGN